MAFNLSKVWRIPYQCIQGAVVGHFTVYKYVAIDEYSPEGIVRTISFITLALIGPRLLKGTIDVVFLFFFLKVSPRGVSSGPVVQSILKIMVPLVSNLDRLTVLDFSLDPSTIYKKNCCLTS